MLKKSYLYIFITGALFISCQNSKQDSTQAEKSDSTTQTQAQAKKETSEPHTHEGIKKVSRYSYEETEPCVLCEGTGKAIYECPTCEGYGYVTRMGNNTCPDCYGEGKIVCYNCDALGRDKCKECNGTGRTRCIMCDGAGKDYNDESCYDCNGTGGIWCNACNGYGLIECPECGGEKDKTCPTCEGYGKSIHRENCPECKGEGGVAQECEICEGSGRTLPSINEEVKKEMSSQSGSGNDFLDAVMQLENNYSDENLQNLEAEFLKALLEGGF